jgi:cell division protein FtsB
MGEIMKRINHFWMTILAMMTFGFGCEPGEITIKKKESYADLVVIYNAEVQSLDALEKKRKELMADFAQKSQEEMLKAAAKSLESFGQPNASGKPKDALDQAVAAAEAQAKLLKNVNQSGTSGSELPEELKKQLAEIDSEISKQKERVQRAKEKRDAAER